jgi:hypothetical protein
VTEPKRDRWGRYLLPDPATGDEVSWTRATTIANTLSDSWGLTDWKVRMAVKGVAMRDDLRALAAALPLEAGKKQLNEVGRDAIEAAGGSVGRHMGTALHEWTAQDDRGEHPDVPEPWDRDVDAYRAALALHGIATRPELVEQVVGLSQHHVAGTFDRIVEWPPQRLIADVKTAAGLDYSWGEIAIQLALYAHADVGWDQAEGAWSPMLEVDRTDAIVIHLPVGEARCDLYLVDIEAGWEAAQQALAVREWRKRKDLHRPIGADMLGRSPVQPVLGFVDEPGEQMLDHGDPGPLELEGPMRPAPKTSRR